MAKRKKDEVVAAMEAAVMEEDPAVGLFEIDGDGVSAADALIASIPEAAPASEVGDEGEDVPSPLDPGWTSYVMGQIPDDEVFDGCPSGEALRRVAQHVLGPTVAEKVTVVQCPNEANQYHAVVQAEVTIAFGGDTRDQRTFADAAEVHRGNMDVKFLMHATACAVTKAKGRAYKAALMLKKVYTSEEMAKGGESPYEVMPGLISEVQIRSIHKYAKDLGFSQAKLIKGSGFTKKYKDVRSVTKEDAESLLGNLCEWLQNADLIPAPLRGGYDPNWLDSVLSNR